MASPPPPAQQQAALRVRTVTVRTVTAFVRLPAADRAAWPPLVAAAGALLAKARQRLQEGLGLEVQTTRLATQPLLDDLLLLLEKRGGGDAELALPPLAAAAAAELQALAHQHGIELVSVGGARDLRCLRAVPPMLAATERVSCSVVLPEPHAAAGGGGCSWRACEAAAAAVMAVAAAAPGGAASFRFAVGANIKPRQGIPFFPVASAPPPPDDDDGDGDDHHHQASFALGLEADALLAEAFEAAARDAAEAKANDDGEGAHGGGNGGGGDVLSAAAARLAEVLTRRLAPIEAAMLALEADEAAAAAAAAAVPAAATAAAVPAAQATPPAPPRWRYLGLDSSIAPGLTTPALTASYERLPLVAAAGGFGRPGTLAVTAAVTRVLKALPLRLTGYCGMMLAVCEDEGLAAAAASGAVTISRLLELSSVCGVGLDTVPVQGPAARQAHGAAAANAAADAADARTTALIAALLADTHALAHRLDKPLAVRLLPLPGLLPGDATPFQGHPYLVDSRVMDLAG